MPDLSSSELVRLQIDAAWDAYRDQEAGLHERLLVADPEIYELIQVSYKNGYIDGWRQGVNEAREIFR